MKKKNCIYLRSVNNTLVLSEFLRLMIGRESDLYQGTFLYQTVLLLLTLRVHRLFRNLDQFEVILIGLIESKGD